MGKIWRREEKQQKKPKRKEKKGKPYEKRENLKFVYSKKIIDHGEIL